MQYTQRKNLIKIVQFRDLNEKYSFYFWHMPRDNKISSCYNQAQKAFRNIPGYIDIRKLLI